MSQAFRAHLANGPAGDPLLVVRIVWGGRVLLFDLGRSEGLPGGVLLRASDVFLSHTHLDHWIGFDHLLRLHVHRDTRIRVWGPPGLARAVEGRLQAYTWNLVERDATVVEAHEVGDGSVETTRFPAAARFRAAETTRRLRNGDEVLAEDLFRIRAVALDHGVPSLAWALEETLRLRVLPDALRGAGLAAGPWLQDLKRRVRRGGGTEGEALEARTVSGGRVVLSLAEARRAFLREAPGQKIVYATDFAETEENAARLAALARDADLFFCEAAFLSRDRALADERRHMTARGAGEIARRAGARRLLLFHFSKRYLGEPGEHVREAGEASGGEVALAPGSASEGGS